MWNLVSRLLLATIPIYNLHFEFLIRFSVLLAYVIRLLKSGRVIMECGSNFVYRDWAGLKRWPVHKAWQSMYIHSLSSPPACYSVSFLICSHPTTYSLQMALFANVHPNKTLLPWSVVSLAHHTIFGKLFRFVQAEKYARAKKLTAVVLFMHY